MELDDCQWLNCFLLPEAEPQYHAYTVQEEEGEDYSETFLQELAPLKNGNEEEQEEESAVVLQELGSVQPTEDETQEQEPAQVPELELDEDVKPSDAPAVSLDRLKSLLASQLKTCLSRVPTAASESPTSAEKAQQDTSDTKQGKEGLLKCDHCSFYFTKEALASHLHSEICHTSFLCSRCSGKFSSKAAFTLHICLSKVSHEDLDMQEKYQCTICMKKFLRYPNLINHAKIHLQENIRCTICKKQFENNRKLINHLMTHKATDDEEKQETKPEKSQGMVCVDLKKTDKVKGTSCITGRDKLEYTGKKKEIEKPLRTSCITGRDKSEYTGKEKGVEKPLGTSCITGRNKSEYTGKEREIEKPLRTIRVNDKKAGKEKDIEEPLGTIFIGRKGKLKKAGKDKEIGAPLITVCMNKKNKTEYTGKEKVVENPLGTSCISEKDKIKKAGKEKGKEESLGTISISKKGKLKKAGKEKEIEECLGTISISKKGKLKKAGKKKDIEEPLGTSCIREKGKLKKTGKEKGKVEKTKGLLLDKNALLSRMSATLNGYIKKRALADKKCDRNFELSHSQRLQAKSQTSKEAGIKTRKPEFKCSVCGSVFANNSALKAHARTHDTRCHLCKNKRFNSVRQLQAHISIAHAARRLSHRTRTKNN